MNIEIWFIIIGIIMVFLAAVNSINAIQYFLPAIGGSILSIGLTTVFLEKEYVLTRREKLHG